MHVFFLTVGWVALAAGVVLLIATVIRWADRPAATPPDPRPPAVNLIWPDDVDHLLDDVAGDLVVDVDRTEPRTLACGHCGHVTAASTTLEAIAADQAHFRTVHAFALALESAS